MPHRVEMCKKILGCKLDEYLKTHEDWYGKGYLCPHTGNQAHHDKLDEIMEDVEQAHDMLHAAMFLAGHKDYRHPEKPSGAVSVSVPSHVMQPKNPY